MSFEAVEPLSRSLLYEGYLLYPYRPSALKNRQRWIFGRVLPRAFSLAHAGDGPWTIQTECLVAGARPTRLEARVRFLQLAPRADESCDQVAETVEREVAAAVRVDEIIARPRRVEFAFPRHRPCESPQNELASVPVGSLLARQCSIEGAVVMRAVEAGDGLFRLTVAIENLTPCRAGDQNLDRALLSSLLSTHTVLKVDEGEFLSLLDPPPQCAAMTAACRNVGAWPVLVGPKRGQMLLSAPIILYDNPRIAPESPGDLFDSTEIDELLTLRIQTLTKAERRAMLAAGEHAQAALRRTESLSEKQLLQMHGRLRGASGTEDADASGVRQFRREPTCDFRPGDRVRLRPHGGADALDALLAGQTGTVVSIERDFEQRIHLGLVVDNDPGRDFGVHGHPGHRFFFGPEDVERLHAARPRILVAGIGNVLFGDDGFGVEVVRQWRRRQHADGVCAVDFGIRGFDLACAILDGYDAVVLVDAVARGDRPGTLYVVEPELPQRASAIAGAVNGHVMTPERVLAWVQALGGDVPPLRLVGCEPAALGPQEEPQMGLSRPVAEAVSQALLIIQSLIEELSIECATKNRAT